MKLSIALLAMLCGCFANGPSHAGRISGTIADLEVVQRSGVPTLLVTLSGSATIEVAYPSCHNATTNPRMLLDMRNDTGRAMASMAYASFYTGRPVRIYGSNVCSLESTVETVSSMSTNL